MVRRLVGTLGFELEATLAALFEHDVIFVSGGYRLPKRHVGLLARTLSVICSANAIQVTSCREHAILQGLFQGSLHDFLLLMFGRRSVGFLLECCDELDIQPDHCVFFRRLERSTGRES